MAICLRPALDSPVLPPYPNLAVTERVRVRHPGYGDGNNLLLELAATDGDGRGIQLGLVHTACAIVADNRFDGRLSRARDARAPPVDLSAADMLPVGEYYFHVPTDATVPGDLAASNPLLPYPIIPSFREWTFPHHALPAPWRTAPINPLAHAMPALVRDSTCRLTNHAEITESAHIVPTAEKDWFVYNMMDTYCVFSTGLGPSAMNTGENMLQLRQDVHSLWDRMRFSVVPKQASGGQDVWTAHVNTPSQELHALYHNRQMQPLSGVRPEFLFARFAWDIFPQLRPFVLRNVQRRLKVRGDGVRDYTGEQCREFGENQGKHRSTGSRKGAGSPGKRQRPSGHDLTVDGNSGNFDSGVSFSSRTYMEGDGDSSQGEEDDFEAQDVEGEETSPISEEVQDPYGYRRRKELAERERSFLEEDPCGWERRRDMSEEQEHEDGLYGDDEGGRGRKRRR